MTEGGEVVVANCGSETVNKFDYNKLKDRDYKGEDYNVDKSLADGPMDTDKRRCTDCLFLIIWFAFLIGMMAMTIDGYVNGDAAYMLAPINQYKQVCGYGLMKDYPYLYAPDLEQATNPIYLYFSHTVCAKSCPDAPREEVCFADEQG